MLKNAQKDFIQRHIGPSKEEQKVMLKELGYNNLDELIAKTVPKKILLKERLRHFAKDLEGNLFYEDDGSIYVTIDNNAVLKVSFIFKKFSEN